MARIRPEEWGFVSGLCLARETGFFADRAFDELAALPPAELASRLARSWFGPAEDLSAFGRIAVERRNREFADIRALSPAPYAVDLASMRTMADAVRKDLAGISVSAPRDEMSGLVLASAQKKGAAALAESLSVLAVPPYDFSAQFAASLLVDAAQLSATASAAERSGEPVLKTWAEAMRAIGCARVTLRIVRRKLPKKALDFFFAMAGRGDEDLSVLNTEERALRLYPDGVAPDTEEDHLLRIARQAEGDYASAGRVLLYLLLFQRQERLLRLAVTASRRLTGSAVAA